MAAEQPPRTFTRPDGWIALALAALLAAFVAVSWQKWALVTADSARELYVPFQILHGARIYEDFYYLYGPVAPVFNASLLAVFGARLEVLYAASLINLALVMGLLYTLARHLLSPWRAGAVVFVFFTHFALGRDIWGYAWPYAFAATYGVTLGLTLLVALARFQATGRLGWLALGGVAVGLSVVTKLEYGFAAAMTGALFLAARLALRRHWPEAVPGWRAWAREAIALVSPALLTAGAIAAAVLVRVPLATVLESVWPVALMKMWNSTGAWHGSAASWVANVKWIAVEAAALGAIALIGAVWARSRVAAVALGAAIALGIWLLGGTRWFYLAEAHTYWMGPSFLVLFGVLGWVAWRLASSVRRGEPVDRALALWGLVAAYGCLVAARTLMTGYNDYTRYQAPVALIVWVAVASVWLPKWGRSHGWWSDNRPIYALLAMLVLALGARHLAGHTRAYLAPHVPVGGPMGTVLTEPRFGKPYNQALSYVKQHLRPGERIVAAPMEASFYLFAGVDNVLKEDQLFYGYLPTSESQRAAIDRMRDRGVRYVLLSSYGFGRMRFGETYMQELGAWLKRECRVVARYGTEAYAVTIYETPFAGRALDR